MTGVKGYTTGGFSSAERKVVVVGHPDVIDALAGEPSGDGAITAVRVEGNFLFDPATHRDFLGAIMGTGVERDAIGDIVVEGDRGCHVVLKSLVAEHVCLSLQSVRTVPVKVGAVLQRAHNDAVIEGQRDRQQGR